ncbi:MAG TPA: DUF4403 family protein [Polyangiaceae bacterium]|nr:DUF4403 family protein [Polyangiaceae bacterium]
MLAVESTSFESLCLAGLVFCSACSGPQNGTSEPVRADCSERLTGAAPSLEPAEVGALPDSQLVVKGDVGEAEVLGLIAAQIPGTLAHEKDRHIGTPGRVTYTVTRGALDSSVRDGTFYVTTLANAQIEVCKPLGPFCVTYGRCQPVLATTVSLPLALNADYGFQSLSTNVRAERGCQIAGFDVTPRLVSLARSNLDAIEQRIERSLPPVKPWAERVWQLSQNPLFLDARHCLRATPKRFVQTPAKQTSTGYEVGVGVDLTLELTTECERTAAPLPLAPLETDPEPAERPALRVAQRVDVASASKQLTESARAAFGNGERVERVTLHTATIAGANAILLEAELSGVTCGTAWLKAGLKPTPRGALTLADVTFLDAETPANLADLPKTLGERGKVTAAFPFADVAKRLNQLLESAAAFADERLAVTVAVGPPKLTAPVVTQGGVFVIAELPTVALLTFRETPR